ncbi:putative secreted protein (Por secretion system target) [Pontibacter virosus]|uniref:Putative secreted protein (Por secretion system target) n=1 Tax=Pontibacter virosus TaxID=1765052 RepID=A0A2U1B674_9BACT|nr:putative secreted protein (Por secretion system target) [Pontibacter virosus]
MRLLYLSVVLLWLPTLVQAQSAVGIGQWQLHVPYTQGRAVADAGDRVYLAAEQGLFYYDKEFRNVQPITRIDGLSEQRISTIGYDPETNTLVIAYANANIDLLQKGRVINLTAILRLAVDGDKTTHHIHIHHKIAYLSTAFGLVVVDLARQEIKDTYTNLGPKGERLAIKASTVQGDWLYLLSGQQVWRANRLTSNLKDFRSWQLVETGLPAATLLTALATFQNQVYLAAEGFGLRVLRQGSWEQVPIPYGSTITHLQSSANYLLGTTELGILLLDNHDVASMLQYPGIRAPRMAVRDAEGTTWIADEQSGLIAWGLGSEPKAFAPPGPGSSNSFRVAAGNGVVYVLSGGYSESYEPLHRANGYYSHRARQWYNNSPALSPADGKPLRDFVSAAYNPVTGRVYMATYGQGLLVWKGEEQPILYNGTNSTLLSTQPATDRTEQIRLTDVAVDAAGQVWTVNRHRVSGAPGLHVLRPDGEWKGYSLLGIADNSNLERLAIDDNGYKWLSISREGNVHSGLVVYDEVRQQVRELRAGIGSGNLPSSAVYSITKDRNGDMWVGTAAGVGVFYSTAAVFSGQVYDARIPIIEGRPLLGGQLVRDIAVDGANRKWMATDNGLWLFSPDGDRMLQHFTTQNSPLPSNKVLSVAIEHGSGEVFVMTDEGIASYRAEATITEGEPDCAQVYPNPVRPDFAGLIGVSGLPNNADVRITDINGTLVHKARATGGTLTWDARGYNGKRIKAGVYLVFAADREARQTCITKIAVLE